MKNTIAILGKETLSCIEKKNHEKKAQNNVRKWKNNYEKEKHKEKKLYKVQKLGMHGSLTSWK